jgi:hypothetical protein
MTHYMTDYAQRHLMGTTGLRGNDLAEATLDHISAYPVDWDQADSVCGTTACFIGRAVLIGLDMDSEEDFDAWNEGRNLSIFDAGVVMLGWEYDDVDFIYGMMTDEFSKLEENVRNIMHETAMRQHP